MLSVVADEETSAELGSSLDQIVREGARRMLAAALAAEVEAYVAAFADERDETAKRLVVRNGHAEGRSLTTGAGPVEVHQPRVNDRRVDETTGQRCRFRSSIIPPWARKSPKVAEVDVPARDELGRLRPRPGGVLQLGRRAVRLGDHPADRPVAGGGEAVLGSQPGRGRLRVRVGRRVHFNIRLDGSRLCALVIVGVRADGTKELVT
jgi:hypothetical protein